MSPREAYRYLSEMKVLSENELGDFWVTRPPPRGFRDLDLFVKCVRTLGAYSVSNGISMASVFVTTGENIDQLRFRLRETSNE